MQAPEAVYEWTFDEAKTNFALLDDTGAAFVTSSQQLAIVYADVVCAASNTVHVAVRIGFGASSLPAIVLNSANGKKDVFTSHKGIAKGGGKTNANGGAAICVGPPGIGPLYTGTVPTGGFVTLILGINRLDCEVVT